MNGSSDEMLFTAGHGFYHFALSRNVFDRSLYYNLLLQPAIAIPDHYLLQGRWVGDHLHTHRDRDSWIEIGLRNGFVQPYFRDESRSLTETLVVMKDADRRGFDERAATLALRLDRSVGERQVWSAPANSENFRRSMVEHLSTPTPPLLELRVDPADYNGFWARSREWVRSELDIASERSTTLLGSEGLLLSQLIQVTGERLLGRNVGRIENVGSLLRRVRIEVGETSASDAHAYYTLACELYNRSLADTMLTAPGSPRWNSATAGLDLAGVVTDIPPGQPRIEDFEVRIELPTITGLRKVSGDVLLTIRKTQASARYFEALQNWRAAPRSHEARAELVSSLRRYSAEIRKQVGKEVGMMGLHPQFIASTADISRVLEKAPNIIHGFLAVSGPATAAYTASTGNLSPWVPAGLFTLFCLQTVAKRLPTSQVDIELTTREGLRVYPDVSVSRS